MTTTLTAHFQAEAWISDHAVAIDDGTRMVDVTEAVLGLSPHTLMRLVNEMQRPNGRDLDFLAEASGAVGTHSGPYTLSIDDDAFADFLADVGLDQSWPITAEAIEAARNSISSAPKP